MKLKDYCRPNVKAKTQNYQESLISSGNHIKRDCSWTHILENNIKNLEICPSTQTWYIINESTDEISFEYIITRTFTDTHTHVYVLCMTGVCTHNPVLFPQRTAVSGVITLPKWHFTQPAQLNIFVNWWAAKFFLERILLEGFNAFKIKKKIFHQHSFYQVVF